MNAALKQAISLVKQRLTLYNQNKKSSLISIEFDVSGYDNEDEAWVIFSNEKACLNVKFPLWHQVILDEDGCRDSTAHLPPYLLIEIDFMEECFFNFYILCEMEAYYPSSNFEFVLETENTDIIDKLLNAFGKLIKLKNNFNEYAKAIEKFAKLTSDDKLEIWKKAFKKEGTIVRNGFLAFHAYNSK